MDADDVIIYTPSLIKEAPKKYTPDLSWLSQPLPEDYVVLEFEKKAIQEFVKVRREEEVVPTDGSLFD